MDALKKVFKEVLEESKALTTLDKLNPDLIKSPSLYGLITSKYQKCEKSNVTMNIEIFADLDNIQWVLTEHTETAWVPFSKIPSLYFVDSDMQIYPMVKEYYSK
jgi:hypothetical protein